MLGNRPNPPNDEGPETITTNTAVNGACQTLLRAAKHCKTQNQRKTITQRSKLHNKTGSEARGNKL